jgi:hypothetical protein
VTAQLLHARAKLRCIFVASAVRYFFSLRFPQVRRILLVESGSRHLIEQLVPILRQYWPEAPIGLVTCYAGLPAVLASEASTEVFHVANFQGRAGRKRLYAELRRRGYDIMGILCTGEPIMTKWKWALALHVPAKVFIVNENCDFFWLDRTQFHTMARFIAHRAGMGGARAAPALLRLLLFPLTLLYLLAYAALAHARRQWNLRFRRVHP